MGNMIRFIFLAIIDERDIMIIILRRTRLKQNFAY